MINFAMDKKQKKKAEEEFDKNIKKLAKDQNVTVNWLKETSNKTVIILAVYKLTKDLKTKPPFLSIEEIADEIFFHYFHGDVDKKFTEERVPELLKVLIKENMLTIENLLTEEGRALAEMLSVNVPDYMNGKRTVQ